MTFILGNLYNQQFETKVKIPNKNSIMCAVLVFISSLTYTIAAAKTSYPVAMAFKSSNVLCVILVAILCSKVKDKKLKLGNKKIITGLIITIGVALFSYFDPQQKDRTRNSQIIGIVLLLVSLLADGFLPDFQAQIKDQYKPQPTEMMQSINKWGAVISFIYMIANLVVIQSFVFFYEHPLFAAHLMLNAILHLGGQFFVYRMIKQFKQHIVPFVITVRKILTIFISVMFFKHETAPAQLIGVFIVLAAVTFQFANEIRKQEVKQEKFQKVVDFNEEIETERSTIQMEAPPEK